MALLLADVDVGRLASSAWPLPIAAAAIAVPNLIASNSNAATVATISLRLIAIPLPGILVFPTTDAVDLADSLVQQLRISSRFAYGTLTRLRLLPLPSDDWARIHRARKARALTLGILLWESRLAGSAVFGLPVATIRRAARLAMAMDSRGFDSRSADGGALTDRATSGLDPRRVRGRRCGRGESVRGHGRVCTRCLADRWTTIVGSN